MKLAVALVCMLLCSAALADAELRFDDGSEVLIKDGRVLFGDDDASIIYPGSGTTMTVVDHENRQYMLIDEEFVGSMSAQMEAAMAEVQAQLEFLPPEQRARMQEMLKQKMPGKKEESSAREFRMSGKKQEVSGFSCATGELYKDGEKEVEMCISTAAELGMSKKDYEALGNAFASMSSLVGQFAQGAEKVFDLEIIGGVPVMTNNLDNEQASRLVWASFEKVDAKRLSVPETYQQKDPSAGM